MYKDGWQHLLPAELHPFQIAEKSKDEKQIQKSLRQSNQSCSSFNTYTHIYIYISSAHMCSWMNGISSLKVNEGACVSLFCVCVGVCVSCLSDTRVWTHGWPLDDERVLGLSEGKALLSERPGRPELLPPPPQSHSDKQHTEKHWGTHTHTHTHKQTQMHARIHIHTQLNYSREPLQTWRRLTSFHPLNSPEWTNNWRKLNTKNENL